MGYGLERIGEQRIRDWTESLRGRSLSLRQLEQELRGLGLSKSEASRLLAADGRDVQDRVEDGVQALLATVRDVDSPAAPASRDAAGYYSR